MGFLVGACLALVVGTVGAVRSAARELAFRRARRQGVELQADVVDNEPTSSGNRGSYNLAPVVRYHLDGRRYTSTVVNASGAPGGVGGSMTIVVHPDHPYAPYDRYAGMGAMARGWLALFALSLVLIAVALASL
ncbi:hypothetical protein [Streptomyces sp. CA-111067]|uniref:hypothetical protein n=1 Tax=Streptomyces sp. CA-111067 TaxID=3240046 RepID=UPI003D99869D